MDHNNKKHSLVAALLLPLYCQACLAIGMLFALLATDQQEDFSILAIYAIGMAGAIGVMLSPLVFKSTFTDGEQKDKGDVHGRED